MYEEAGHANRESFRQHCLSDHCHFLLFWLYSSDVAVVVNARALPFGLMRQPRRCYAFQCLFLYIFVAASSVPGSRNRRHNRRTKITVNLDFSFPMIRRPSWTALP